MQSSDRARGFDPALESLRGIAALSVAYVHSIMVFTGAFDPTTANLALAKISAFVLTFIPAGAGIIIFFVLSGFVLARSLERDADPVRFIIRRGFRLFPAMWVSLLLTMAVTYYFASETPYENTTDWFKSVYWPLASFDTFTDNALLLEVTLNPVIWTLRPELAGSILLPIIFFIHRRTGWVVRYSMLATIFFVGIPSYRFWMQFLFCFYLGMLLPTDVGRLIKGRASAHVAAAVGYSLMFGGTFIDAQYSPPMKMCTAIGGAILIAAIASEPRPWHILEIRPLRFVGKVSYSLYLVHLPVLFACASIARMAPDIMQPGFTANIILAAVSIPLTIILAAAMHRFIEIPSINLGRWILAPSVKLSTT